MARDQFVSAAATELEGIQRELHAEAGARRDANLVREVSTFAELEAHFAEDRRYPGWVELVWSRPGGDELEAVVTKLKALKLTIRNAALGQAPISGACPFTGKPAVERITIARAY